MGVNNQLQDALAAGAQEFLARAQLGVDVSVPVYALLVPSADEVERQASRILERVQVSQDIRPSRARLTRTQETCTLVTSSGIRALAFYASGYVTIQTPLKGHQHFISARETDVNPSELIRAAEGLMERLAPAANLMHPEPPAFEKTRFEKLWQIKGTSVLPEQPNQAQPVVTSRAVGAFRRNVHGLSVFGPASIFIKFAASSQLDSLGMDWRPLRAATPLASTPIVPPDRAAARLAEELSLERMESEGPIDGYTPEWVRLGYLSLPKRRTQALLQPVWVTLLRAKSSPHAVNGTLDRLIAVPASTTPLEPISRYAPGPDGSSIRRRAPSAGFRQPVSIERGLAPVDPVRMSGEGIGAKPAQNPSIADPSAEDSIPPNTELGKR